MPKPRLREAPNAPQFASVWSTSWRWVKLTCFGLPVVPVVKKVVATAFSSKSWKGKSGDAPDSSASYSIRA